MKKTILFLLTLSLFVSCSKQTQQEEQQLTEVTTLAVQTQPCSVPFLLPAQLRGKQDIFVVPQISALLTEVLIQEGQFVKKGQRMFILDETEYRSAYDNAVAMLRTAELEEQAKKELFKKDIISEHEYRVSANKLESAKANVRNAKNNLNHCVIVAPSDGVVGNINHRQGALVGPQIDKPLTVVSDNHIIYAYISMSEKVYNNLMLDYNGDKEAMLADLPACELILNNDSVYETVGHIETLSGIIDPTTGALSVRVAFDNPKGILAAGGTATLRVKFDIEGIVIPRVATYEFQDKTQVYKVVGDSVSTLEATIVEPYRLNETEYIIFEGLQDGDVIVTQGVKKLTNGQHVKVIPDNINQTIDNHEN